MSYSFSNPHYFTNLFVKNPLTTSTTIPSTHCGFNTTSPTAKIYQEGVKYATETFFTFTGRELDAETGYSYFGARYYAPASLAAWLSVDPMSDKNPSISPYAYCAWNPLKLVDPNGEEVEYDSFFDRCYVFVARICSKGFRMRYNDLKDSKEVYVFNYNDNGDNKLTTDGEKLFINYSLDPASRKDGSTIISLLMHETEHAVQFEYGEIGFQKDESGKWQSLNFDINDELKAREFESSSIFKLNSQSVHTKWGIDNSKIETRSQQIDFLREQGYNVPDAVWNNRMEDVGKDGTKFALQY